MAKSSILFVTSSRIGDAVLSSGLIRRLSEETPDARFTIAAGPVAAPLFRDVPGLERLIVVEKRPGAGHWLELWRATRGRRWALVVDLRGSKLSAFLRARRRAVFGPSTSGREPTHKVVQAARLLGIEGKPPAPFLYTNAATEAAAAALVGEGGPVLAIGPGANWRGKAWPAERFAALVGALTAAGALFAQGRVLLLGDAADRTLAEVVGRAVAPERVIDLTGRVDLLTAYAALKRARLFVGADSGLMHLAAAAGVATLGLFGPSDERLYGPWGAKTRTVRGPRDFAAFKAADPGLNQPVCHMLDLEVAAVLQAATALYEETADG